MAIDWDGLVLAPLHAAFGETVNYVPSVGQSFTLIDAVLDRGYVQVGMDAGGVAITAWSTILGIRPALCPAGFSAAAGDQVINSAGMWQVVDVQPDGKGNVLLVLSALDR
jgi:hypothetical protein